MREKVQWRLLIKVLIRVLYKTFGPIISDSKKECLSSIFQVYSNGLLASSFCMLRTEAAPRYMLRIKRVTLKDGCLITVKGSQPVPNGVASPYRSE